VDFSTKVRGIIVLLVIATGIYVGWNLFPPYFNKFQFQDDLDDIVRRASYTTIPEDDLKQAVIKKAQARDIVIKENQVSLSHIGTTVAITVHYSVHVDMVVHPVDLEFTVDSHNKALGS
jgi:hypothetical protein